MPRRILVLITLLALAITPLATVGTAGAASDAGGHHTSVPESTTGSYVVVMATDPLVATEGADGLNTDAAKSRDRALRASHDRALRGIGKQPSDKVNDYTVALNGFSALLSHDEAEAIARQEDVAFVVPDVIRLPQTDSSTDFIGLTGPHGAWEKDVTGEGVVIGVIDSGIWPEHPSFADDSSYSPSPLGPLPCEFGNTAHNPADAAFDCNNKLLGARQMLATYRALIGAEPDEFDSARDDNGHGTHTASTAAGNADVAATLFGQPAGVVSGIAPRARVVAYKGLGLLGGFSSDLAAAIDQAVADGVDVINYSIGGGAGLTGADEIAFLFAADAGVFVATSAGNSGEGAATIGGPGSVPWLTTVGASTQYRFFEGTVTLGNSATYTGASVTGSVGDAPLVDAADAGDELCQLGELDPAVVAGAIVLCKRGAVARVEKSLEVMNQGGVGMIMYETDDVGNLFSDPHWVPSVHVDNTPGLAVKAYIASSASPTARIDAFAATTWPHAPSMTDFSSRGPDPVAEDIIKPDVTAPGMQILAGNSPAAIGGQPGELFQAIAGTSMSSPHVAGIFALIKQEHPDWSPAAARSALMTTATQNVLDNDRVSPADPFDMGAGHVDPGSPKSTGSAFQPGLVYDAGFLDYLGFLCDEAPEVFANPTGTCGALASIGVPTEAHDLNYPSIGVSEAAGSQTVTRTVTSVAPGRRTFTASVEAPEGYDVTVSPSSFTLRQGQSRTFTVTITNTAAPIGEWRFGSLTWNESRGLYQVRSPIAAKAALFSAPAEITGSGESGTASFDVRFGYTGDYTAAAHGLDPAALTVDNVAQDPDQSFDPDDGFSDAHTFNLSGAAFFRVAIPPEATEADADLDVFVFDPDGDLVAASTLGGTDEEVSIADPMDGTWTVYVHGWQAPGGDSDYTMYSWVISATPGGNLNIDSAPTSATMADTATIDLSWTGASSGQWHLGAVSHSDASGRIGLTLVAVDNR